MTQPQVKIGDIAAGGCVFFIDAANKFGYVYAVKAVTFQNLDKFTYDPHAITGVATGATLAGFHAGAENNQRIVTHYGDTDDPADMYAALAVAKWSHEGFKGWFMPTADIVNHLRSKVWNPAANIAHSRPAGAGFTSTETNATNAYIFDYPGNPAGGLHHTHRKAAFSPLAIRKFTFDELLTDVVLPPIGKVAGTPFNLGPTGDGNSFDEINVMSSATAGIEGMNWQFKDPSNLTTKQTVGALSGSTYEFEMKGKDLLGIRVGFEAAGANLVVTTMEFTLSDGTKYGPVGAGTAVMSLDLSMTGYKILSVQGTYDDTTKRVSSIGATFRRL